MGTEEKRDWQRVGELGGGYVEVHGLFSVLFCMFLLVIKWYISDLLESSLRITKNQSWVTSWEMVR